MAPLYLCQLQPCLVLPSFPLGFIKMPSCRIIRTSWWHPVEWAHFLENSHLPNRGSCPKVSHCWHLLLRPRLIPLGCVLFIAVGSTLPTGVFPVTLGWVTLTTEATQAIKGQLDSTSPESLHLFAHECLLAWLRMVLTKATLPSRSWQPFEHMKAANCSPTTRMIFASTLPALPPSIHYTALPLSFFLNLLEPETSQSSLGFFKRTQVFPFFLTLGTSLAGPISMMGLDKHTEFTGNQQVGVLSPNLTQQPWPSWECRSHPWDTDCHWSCPEGWHFCLTIEKSLPCWWII